ncbi:MAG TPA: hypothetical protein VHN99_07525 [Deinococcales bacterium]|nr:hypothetical protein [Deinococcales bacterium]
MRAKFLLPIAAALFLPAAVIAQTTTTTPATQPAPAAQPATPATPEAQPATPATPEAQPATPAAPAEAPRLEAAPVSFLTSITFPKPGQRPAGATVAQANESIASLNTVIPEITKAKRTCGTGELLFWQQDAFGQDPIGFTKQVNAKLKAFGYTVTERKSGFDGEYVVSIFTATSPHMDVLGVWGLRADLVTLIWCRLEGTDPIK